MSLQLWVSKKAWVIKTNLEQDLRMANPHSLSRVQAKACQIPPNRAVFYMSHWVSLAVSIGPWGMQLVIGKRCCFKTPFKDQIGQGQERHSKTFGHQRKTMTHYSDVVWDVVSPGTPCCSMCLQKQVTYIIYVRYCAHVCIISLRSL